MAIKLSIIGKMLPLLAAFVGIVAILAIYNEEIFGILPRNIRSVSVEQQEADIEALEKYIIENISRDNIRSYLRYLTKKPHLGGTPAEWETAQWTASLWRNQGLDEVHLVPYKVILSYPHDTIPNKVMLVDSMETMVWTAAPKQKPLHAPEESMEQVPFSFNAYSANGTAMGELVYVNYGSHEDWDYLDSHYVTVKGKIVIARYGTIYRANIAKAAEVRGALGLILYSDPEDAAPLGTDFVYPHSIMLPPSGAPFGNCKLSDGDPSTPHYPATDSAYRVPEAEWDVPHILVQPIGYEDAYVLLRNLEGPDAPDDWQGAFNFTYHIGSQLKNGLKVKMDILTSNKLTTIYNVIGIIRGGIEPDRYVVLGNHRDAWIFGSSDPSSGSASMMELSRVFMQYVNKTGWHPRRSLVFISWGAEEPGLVGSLEFTEQFGKQLAYRTVAYLNNDMSLEGNYTLRTKSVPLLYDIVRKGAKKIPNPDFEEVEAGRKTVYDTWTVRKPDQKNPGQPVMQMVGSGTDYVGFLHHLGIPCLDIRYTHDNRTIGFPLYHTLYETFALIDEVLDKGFYFHKAITALWGVLAIRLSESQILPFALEEYVIFLQDALDSILSQYGDIIASQGITFDYFQRAVDMFNASVVSFRNELNSIDTSNPLEVRRMNDQLLMVERSFLDPRGIPGRPQYMHVVAAPSKVDAYSATPLAGLSDALAAIAKGGTTEETNILWQEFQQHLASVTHLVETAAKVLTNDLW